MISFTAKQNLHDFRYEGGAPINSGPQIPLVNENRVHASKLGPPDSTGTDSANYFKKADGYY